MCNPLSAIVLNDGTLHYCECVDSHTEILAVLGIADTQDNMLREAFARVELMFDPARPTEPDKWMLKVDQTITPAWWEKYEDAVGARLRRIAAKMIIHEDTEIVQQRRVILAGRVKVGTLRCQEVLHAGHATIKYAGNATIRRAGKATIENAGNATIEYAGKATILHAGNATIRQADYPETP